MSFAAEHAGDNASHWDYTGQRGPGHWASLDPKFAACAGRNQSPVDLDHFIEAELPPIAFDYKVGGHDVVNNGHTIQVDYDAGSSISIDNDAFELKQFHFHAPSENHIDGKSFPIEAHFVHADAQGNLAVVAVMFVQGAEQSGTGNAVGPHAGQTRRPAGPVARRSRRRTCSRQIGTTTATRAR